MNGQKVRDYLSMVWQEGFFGNEATFPQIMEKLGSVGFHPTPQALNSSLSHAQFLTRKGKPGNYKYIQKFAPKEVSFQPDIFPDELVAILKKDFETELLDLRHNFGVSGTCTAFLLRKILEKMIFLAFAKNGEQEKLYEADGKMVGLTAMLNLARVTKVGGKPFLMHKTVEEIQGLKFLGDSAAHNPLTNVSMKTILPVMPFIVTAYSELAVHIV